MPDTSNIKLTIALKEPDLEAEELEKQARNLVQELKDIDEVEDASLVAVTETPQGSKALGGFLLGILQAEVSIENCKKLFSFLGDRLGGKPIELEVEANGKKLKVTASSREELMAAIQAAQEFVA
ncbi:hypothetical protein [Fischerella sp. PCC 9605]|uniref:hypothetical protein n=1 Tax=Fischerella sp. PCC 9605 TaxID=1173024 RepID=UPI00047BFF65|nr:hypothetical protein [Fischerella sp. PCC 9605]